jgi:asparagine synthase (glutamine-hydrolysing)
MCGLTGFLDSNQSRSADRMHAVASAMAATLIHRGPDDAGVWVEAESGVALAFRRLSIIDRSPSGHQPMMSVDGRYVLVFNGEIYNYRDLAQQLADVPKRGTSDTEVLLAAITRWGVEIALPRLNGMFALAVWDRRHRRLTLARDRIGEKPLYYGTAGESIVFGSELKALRSYPDFKPEIDREALTLYVRHNMVPAPHSIFRGIKKLPPGCYVDLCPGSAERIGPVREYWSAVERRLDGLQTPLNVDGSAAADLLEEQLRRSVASRMVADVPVGAFLSGGIDSSTVVALMQAQSSQPVRTYSIGFAEEGYDEAGDAKRVAGHLETEHTELYVSPSEAQAVIPSLHHVYDEPFADSSQIPTLLVSQLARRDVTVALSGDGGDELFGGYDRYQTLRRIGRLAGRVPFQIRRAAAGTLLSISPARWDALVGPHRRFLPSALRPRPGDRIHKASRILSQRDPMAIYAGLLSVYDRPEEIVLGAREPSTALTRPSVRLATLETIDRAALIDLLLYLPDDILAKIDRASMSTSLEVRVPLLDHELVELAWRLPSNVKVRGGTRKWVLREVLHRHVPRELVERPKMGFAVPVGAWLRGPLHGWADALLDATRLADEGWFDSKRVRVMWQEHQSGVRNWQEPLWGILMFQAWLETTR